MLSPKTAHSGGTATCHSKATCTDCKTEYGGLNPDNHVGHNEIRGVIAATDKTAGYTGDTYCLDCNKKILTGEKTPILGESSAATGDNMNIPFYTMLALIPGGILTILGISKKRKNQIDK